MYNSRMLIDYLHWNPFDMSYELFIWSFVQEKNIWIIFGFDKNIYNFYEYYLFFAVQLRYSLCIFLSYLLKVLYMYVCISKQFINNILLANLKASMCMFINSSPQIVSANKQFKVCISKNL